MRKPSTRQAAIVHPDQLSLFGGPPPAPRATPDPARPATPRPARSTVPTAVEERSPAGPLAVTPATASTGPNDPVKPRDDPSTAVDTLAQPADASPGTALPSCQQTVAEEAHGPASDAEEGEGNHTACLWRGASRYSPPETCDLREAEIGVPLTQLLEIYELLGAFVADEQPSSGPPRRRGDGPGTAP